MNRPVIHNRFLPGWLHRIFCGLFGAVVFVTLWAWLLSVVPTEALAFEALHSAIWLTPVVSLLCFLAAPRISVVRGLAGEAGYDELSADQASSQTVVPTINGPAE